MRKNFWENIKKPFFCLAPMADVTDVAFRRMLAKYGKEATRQNKNFNWASKKQVVFWTEFVSADGLCNKEGRKHLAHILKFSKIEKPIVAQVFGANPVNMEKACRLISKLGFDGIDINMGCPDKSVIKQGAGSALIKNSKLAREIIKAAILGANGLPVSVKTRVGFNKEEIDTWIPELLKEDIKAITIHARTKKEMSKVPAHWDYVKRVVELVKASRKNTRLLPKGGQVLVIGNGDVKSIQEGEERIKETGCDGVMIGRGVFGNPWFFSGRNQADISIEEKLSALLEHTKLFEKLLGREKNFDVMKKHYKAYVNGFAGAKELRVKLMSANSYKEVKELITNYPSKAI
jgi:nifR3 family TIM-barrel protein